MKSNLVIRTVVTALLLTGALSANAAEPQAAAPAVPASAGVATYGQLDEMRSQNALLEMAVKNAELRSKLAGGKSSAAQDLGGPPAPTRPAPAPAPAPASAAVALGLVAPAASTASVDLVASDSEGRMTAILVLDSGRKVKARVGSQIPGVGTIRSISIDEVVAVVKGKTVSLPFGVEPTLGTSSAPAGAMPGMPGLSTVMPPIPAMMRGGR